MDPDQARLLRGDLQKVRCWLTGFAAGRHVPGSFDAGIPGESGLRMIDVMLAEAIAKAAAGA